jgi:uncharacterized membrane protein
MYSKVKIFGHPMHPMVVAYPIAFYTSTLVAFVVYAASGDPFWLKLAIAANIAGVVMAVVAAIPGFLDWALGIPSGTRAKTHGLRHLILNVSALILFAINMLAYAGEWESPTGVSVTLGITLSAVGVLLTVAAGFHGWMLIQDDHVGVRLTAEQEAADLANL